MSKQKTKAQVAQELADLQAQDLTAYRTAYRELDKLKGQPLMASGVVITIRALGGKELVRPFCIIDGPSDTTITDLQEEIRRSYDYRVGLGRP